MVDTILIVNNTAHEIFPGVSKESLSSTMNEGVLSGCVEVPEGTVGRNFITVDGGSTWRPPIPGKPEHYTYTGGQWVENSDKAEMELEEKTQKIIDVNKIGKLVFKVMFDMENRMRVQEGKASVTSAQYRNALKAIVDTL